MRHVSQSLKLLAAAAAGVVLSAIPAFGQTVSGPYDVEPGFTAPWVGGSPSGAVIDPVYATAVTYGGARYRGLSDNNKSPTVVIGVGSPTSPSAVGGDPISAGGANQTSSNFPNPYTLAGSSSIEIDYTPAGGVLPAYYDTAASLPAGSTSTFGSVTQILTSAQSGSPYVNGYNLPSAYAVTLPGANGILNWLHILIVDGSNGTDGNPSTLSLNNVSLTQGGGPAASLGNFSAAYGQDFAVTGSNSYDPSWDVTGVNLNNGFDLTANLVESSNFPANGGSETNKVEVGFGAVPEPGTLSLLTLGAMGVLARRRRA